jgi:hypothetical protein
MKKYIILSIALLSAMTSCKKSWLEVIPTGSQLAINTSDYDKLMNGPVFYRFSFGGIQEAQLMGDEISAEQADFVNLDINYDYRDRYFEWRDVMFPEANIQPFGLRSHLGQMYPLNKIINEVMDAQNGTDSQKKAIRAEAMATRAFCYFLITNFYCKPYLASSAGTDPGFPVITATDITQENFDRGTLQQTYDFIIKDLKDALVDIPVKQNFLTRMSRPAVEGLLGKVYLFMGRYDEALPLLKAALDDVIANGQVSLYNYNQTLVGTGAFMPIDPFVGPTKSPGQVEGDMKESILYKACYSGAYAGNGTGNNGLVLTSAAQALYDPSDFRLLFYSKTYANNAVNPAGRIRKYNIKYTRFGLQLSELYLLLAECKARTNDLTGAVADLETLRKNRMPAAAYPVAVAVASNRTALIKFIIDERIREFALEGYRWFDMRRLSVDPLFPAVTAKHTIYSTANPNVPFAEYTLKPERLTMRFPRYITDANPTMPNNP